MANPVNWFEIPVSDLRRARALYQGVFGFVAHFQYSEGNRVALHSVS